MRYFAPYIVTAVAVILIVPALLIKTYSPKIRDYKYGNPEFETLVQNYKNTHFADITVKLYIGKDNSGGALWYSVTVEKPNIKESQIFASFGEPVIDKVSIVEDKIKLTAGKTSIDIPLREIDERIKSPLAYNKWEDLNSEKAASPDQI
jgi:hypothetical protein